MPLTTERLTDFYGTIPARRTVDMAANVTIFKGAMVAINSAGNALPAGLLAGGSVRVVGVAAATRTNGATAAATQIEVSPGVFRFNNQAGDLVTKADVGAQCFVADDFVVARTNGTNTRPVAGIVQAVEPDGTVRVFIA